MLNLVHIMYNTDVRRRRYKMLSSLRKMALSKNNIKILMRVQDGDVKPFKSKTTKVVSLPELK